MNKFTSKGNVVLGDDNLNQSENPIQLTLPQKEDRIGLKQVAELFGTTPQTILNWRKKNIIPYYQINKFTRPFYSKSQLTKLASQNQHLIKQ